jgi:peroxiredoxin Q/BCP
MTKLKIAEIAPEFSLLNQHSKEISLANLLKKNDLVVLYFYPRAMTPGCTTQAQGMCEIKTLMSKKKVAVVGIAPDAPGKLLKFAEKYSLDFDLLSDEDKAVTKSYGAWGKKKFMGKEFMGVLRQTFFIGKNAKIREIFTIVKTKTHHLDVAEWIQRNL